MLLKFIFLTCIILEAIAYDEFGISSAFLHTVTSPKQVAFLELGEYSGRTYKNVGYKKSYYVSKFFKANWHRAKAFCKAFDLELATFETSEEAANFLNNQHFIRFIENYDYISVIVDGFGFTPTSSTEWYSTNTGVKIPYNLQWLAGEPNYYGNDEYCLSVAKQNKNGPLGFNDYPCNEYPTRFICQKTLMTS